MNHLSLFTGIGGFDLGFEQAGIPTVGQIEYDQPCRSVLERHWPNIPRWGDITEVDPDELPDADIWTGGFPCQDISLAGRRAGLAGERSGLWFQFARLAAAKRPRWLVIENVAGLLSSNRGRDMGTILGWLGEHGYGFAYRVLDSVWFGVPQRRRRVFLVGHLGEPWGAPAEVLAVAESSVRDTPTRRPAGPQPTQALRAGTYGGGGPDDNKAQGGFYIAETTQVPSHDPHPTLTSRTYKGAAVEGDHDAVIYTVHATGMTPALTANAKLAFQQNTTVRRLTPVECARLQGFPDNWNDHLADTQRYRQYGNAVTVPVAQWVATQTLKHC